MRKTLSVIFISLITLTFLLNSYHILSNQNIIVNDKNSNINELYSPNSAVNVSLLQDPFTRNFEGMIYNLLNKTNSDLEINASIYNRYGANPGNTNNNSFSKDNLISYVLLNYDELTEPGQYSGLKLYAFYNAFKTQTDFWYEGNLSNYEYGFIHSIDGTTGEIVNDNRYLLDNALPIFLFRESYTESFSNQIDELFELINSSQFYDDVNIGFYHSNSSISEYKYSMDNLYGILANLMIHRNSEITPSYRNQAYNLANNTFNSIIANLWDNEDFGFYNHTSSNWALLGGSSEYKFLDVNALGIITLLEYWLQSGMENDSVYLENATLLYTLLDTYLWNETYNAYELFTRSDWFTQPADVDSYTLDLSANALMMRACLKLFSVTGNITYYDRALKLYDFFETYLYNDTAKAYMTSIGYQNNTMINLNSNLELVLAYLDAFQIYKSTQLSVWFNETYSGSGPDFIINEDTMNITSSYDIILTDNYYNPISELWKPYTIWYNITAANITYKIRYPNWTIFDSETDYIESNVTKGSIAEKTKLTCKADNNGSLNGTYFLLNTPSYNFYIWFNVNDSGALDPGLSDREGIEIYNITVNSTKEQVASNISSYLQLNGNFTVLKNNENLTITNKELGKAINATDGTTPLNTSFTIEILVDGDNRTVSEHNLLYFIPENMSQGDSYTIYIYSNTSFFGFAHNNLQFNIISGVDYDDVGAPIEGLDALDDSLYQGQTVNVSIPIHSIRANNITLNVSLIAEGIEDIIDLEFNFTSNDVSHILLNITALVDANLGEIGLNLILARGNIVYLNLSRENKEIPLTILNALAYDNLIYRNKVVTGNDIKVSINLINYLPANPQSFNISFSGVKIQDIKNEVTLNPQETRTNTYSLVVSEDLIEDSITIEMKISKGTKQFYTENFEIDIVPVIKIISASFTEKVPQGGFAYLILIIQNNREDPEEFSLLINGEVIEANINKLGSGENKIMTEFQPTINPYEFGSKHYQIMIKNSQEDIIFMDYFEVAIEISALNLVLFYILPVLIPIGIIVYSKNKDLKNKLLKR